MIAEIFKSSHWFQLYLAAYEEIQACIYADLQSRWNTHLWDCRENFTITQSYAFVSVSAKLKLTQKECAQS